MNMLHERSLTIARCNQGKGSMRLTVTDKGVEFEFEAPKCDIGERCLEMVRRGDYSGCSFEFYPEEYDVEERDGGNDVKIIHRKFRAITALTIGLDPAYRQTSVNARELYEQTPAAKAKREKEALEKKQEEERKAEELRREMIHRRDELAMLSRKIY